MRQLPLIARGYLFVCYLLGALACSWLVFSHAGTPPSHEDWLLGIGLAAIAATCQVFIVASNRTSGAHSDHLTPAPLFAAVLLLPRPVLAAVLIATWLPEWYLHRRPWFIQMFNIAAYMIAGAVVRWGWVFLLGSDHVEGLFADATYGAPYVLAAIVAFLGTQTLLLALILKLARKRSFRQSGLFAPNKVLVEVGLVCLGLGFAIAWNADPIYGIATALPLVLIFQALHVPNLKEAAASDPKTGLANMRHFNDVLARQLEYAAHNEQPCSVLMCDLDYLRKINNTYGHQAGDTVLIGISDIIRRHLHDTDIAARFGGEEFVILLPNTPSDDAQQVAESLRAACEAARFAASTTGAPIGISVSIGVATFPDDGLTAEHLLREADLAVYQAKREGRNRVVVAGRESRALAGEWAREHLVSPLNHAYIGPKHVAAPLQRLLQRATSVSTNYPWHAKPAPYPATSDSGHQAAPQQRLRTKAAPSAGMLLMIGTMLLAGLIGLLPHITPEPASWSSLSLFVVMTVIAEFLAVDVSGRGKTSVAVVIILSAALLYGALGIVTTALAFAISVGIKAHSPLHRVCFNFGAVLLSAEGARWSFGALTAESIQQVPFAAMLVPGMVAGLVFYVINHALLCLIRGVAEQRPPWQIWHSDYRWLWPHYIVLGALALIVALGYLHFGPLGVVVLMAPVAMMHLAIKQYMDRTTIYVDELRQLNDQLAGSYEATLQALTRALDTRDEETEEHSQRVKRYTKLMAERLHLGKDELEDIVRGALLHDIGKIGVPDAILLKTGRLTEEERAQIRKHPEIGYSMIAHIPFLARAAQVVLHHHEAYDGSGYPSGLAGANIPIGARIFAVADAYDAMTSDRPYRKAMSHLQACEELQRCRGKQFDPFIVDTFLAIPYKDLRVVQQEVSHLVEQSQRLAYEETTYAGDTGMLEEDAIGEALPPSAAPHWGGVLRHSAVPGQH